MDAPASDDGLAAYERVHASAQNAIKSCDRIMRMCGSVVKALG